MHLGNPYCNIQPGGTPESCQSKWADVALFLEKLAKFTICSARQQRFIFGVLTWLSLLFCDCQEIIVILAAALSRHNGIVAC